MSNVDEGTKIYTPFTLKLYDWWVLSIFQQLRLALSDKRDFAPLFFTKFKT